SMSPSSTTTVSAARISVPGLASPDCPINDSAAEPLRRLSRSTTSSGVQPDSQLSSVSVDKIETGKERAKDATSSFRRGDDEASTSRLIGAWLIEVSFIKACSFCGLIAIRQLRCSRFNLHHLH